MATTTKASTTKATATKATATKAQPAKATATKASTTRATATKASTTKATATKATATKGSTTHEDRIGVELPNGYVVRWPHASWDAAKRGPNAPAGSPMWLIICNAHNTTTTTNGSNRRYLGSAEGRTTWCGQCAKAAK
jgi:hypothetical protein